VLDIVGFGQQEAEEGQNLAADRRAGHLPVADYNGYATLILDKGPICKSTG
jgi:hypothetical protein